MELLTCVPTVQVIVGALSSSLKAESSSISNAIEKKKTTGRDAFEPFVSWVEVKSGISTVMIGAKDGASGSGSGSGSDSGSGSGSGSGSDSGSGSGSGSSFKI